MPPVASELPHTCQAIIDALQAKLDKKARDADNSACSSAQIRAAPCVFSWWLCVAVRASLRQLEHRLQEEGLRIQQLVDEFKFKQKTIGVPRRHFNHFYVTPWLQASSRTRTPPCANSSSSAP